MTQPPPPVRLAILVTDQPLPQIAAKLGPFDAIFTTLLRNACASLDPPQTLNSQLTLTSHDVVNAAPDAGYPDPEAIDAVLITGSRAAAYAEDAWVVRLVEYVRLLLEGGRVRVVGVCFGHQIVARALGARVAPSPKGWELSVTEIELTEEGKRVFGREKLVSVLAFLEVLVTELMGGLLTTMTARTSTKHIGMLCWNCPRAW